MSSVITTDFERWKAQEAALGKPVALNEFVFANVPGLDPSKDISRDEKLPPAGQIVHRQAVNKAGLASENAVAYSVTLGTDTGDFVFNWIGLINKESGTLAMITHAPEQRKIKTVDGVQGNVLTRSFLLEFNGAAKETQITTSAETWQIDFTARLAGMDEIQRLSNRDIYGAAAFFGDGFLVTKAAEQYRVTPGTAYIEGLRGTLEEITTFNNLRDTKIYADYTFQGNLVSKWQTFVKVTTAKTLAHYQDAAGFQHYVAVIAEIDKNGNITDKRVKGTQTDRELEKLIKELPEKYQPIGDYVENDDLSAKLKEKRNIGDMNFSGNINLMSTGKNDFLNFGGTGEGYALQVAIANNNTEGRFYFHDRVGKKTIYLPINNKSGTIALINDIPSVVQSTGLSTTDVMSQKAVTDELDKKFSKNGGTITTSSKAIDIVTKATYAGYIQISDADGNIIHQLGKTNANNGLLLRNAAEGGTLAISGDGVRFNGGLLALVSDLPTAATKYNNLTSSRNSNVNYVNNKGHVIFVILESGDSANQNLTTTVDGVSVRWLYTGTVEGAGVTATIPVPPGAKYSANGFVKWIEVS
ncbi:phage tail-collar fiber domain-containing protein [Morganella morganii]|uniref:phage tail-collar fiber domain-containing protein n=1 Tax=Morganella morganii TaxID=582 RepID=UPI00339CAA26